MKKLNACSQGGFKKLQLRILTGEETKCEACLALMQEYGFDAEAARQKAVDAANGLTVDLEDDKMEGKDKMEEDEEQSVADLLIPPAAVKEDKKSEEILDHPAACKEWMKQHDPIVTLLPAGSYNKIIPYRCVACKSKRWPHGRIGECKKMKLYMVRHFVMQHINSPQHQVNVERMNMQLVQEKIVPCMGLPVNLPQAGNLYIFRKEFGLWATYADFECSAKHKYIYEASSNQWIIRSCSCKENTPLRGAFEHQVCVECENLSSSHSASWLYLPPCTL